MSTCELCGEPMPPGEEMFKYHGYSGPCPKPPLPAASAPAGPPTQPETLASLRAELETLRSVIRWELETIAAQPSDRILPGFHFRAWLAELRRRAGMENET